MGLMDLIRPNDGEDRGQWRDVPIGFRLGLLGNIIANAANGGGQGNMAGFAAMANMTQGKVDERKAAKKLQRENELAARYLEKRPDLKPLVEAGVISVGDIIKMDREDQKTVDDRNYNREDWLYKQKFESEQAATKAAAEAAATLEAEKRKQAAELDLFKQKEQFKLDNDPNKGWWEQFAGGGGVAPAPGAGPNNAPVPGSTPLSPAVTAPPAPPAPGMTPDPTVATNGQEVDATTQKIRQSLGDPNITPQEARFIVQTVRNPDDLRSAYQTVLSNRTEQAKVKAEQEKLALEKEEAAKKEAGLKASGQASMTTAVTAVDQAIAAIDAPGMPAAGIGSALKFFPQTNAYQASEAIETLKSYISIEKLAEMRQNSTSGASGLGQVTNYEQRMLAASQGTIAQGLDPELLRSNLKNVRAKIVAFNTPSAEDPSISQMEMDARKLAAGKDNPKVIEAFEAKYGIGSSSAITGDTTAAADREPVAEDAPAITFAPEEEDVINRYLNGGN